MTILAVASGKDRFKTMDWPIYGNSIKNTLKPTNWLPASELESMPSMEWMTLEKLEQMSVQEGAEWMNKMCKQIVTEFKKKPIFILSKC